MIPRMDWTSTVFRGADRWSGPHASLAEAEASARECQDAGGSPVIVAAPAGETPQPPAPEPPALQCGGPVFFATTLKAARRRAGLTQADVARHMDCARQAVQRLESPANNPTEDSVRRYCLALGCSAELRLVPRNRG